MNCQQGDLAIVVHAKNNNANLGKIVRCVRLSGGVGARWYSPPDSTPAGYAVYYDGPVWEIDPPIVYHFRPGGPKLTFPYMPDAYLRPLRDRPGVDETLTFTTRKYAWPHPQGVTNGN